MTWYVLKLRPFIFWFIVFRRLEGNELDGMSFSDRVVGACVFCTLNLNNDIFFFVFFCHKNNDIYL